MTPDAWMRALGLACLLAGGVALTGCATAGRVFAPGGYAAEGGGFRAAIEEGSPARLEAAAQTAARRAERGDEVLYRLEEGRLRALAGDLAGSTRALQRATDLFEEERQQPLVRVSEGFFGATALATNDRALPYESAGHERLMAYNLLALNHLRAGDAAAALIALNGAVAEMDYLRDKSAALQRAETQRAGGAGLDPRAIGASTAAVRERLRAEARPDLVPYANAFTFFLQSLLFEQMGDSDRAKIALRRAAELAPEHPAIEAVSEQGWRASREEALVVLIFAEGLVTPRTTIGLPFVWHGTILQIAMPVYPERSGRGGLTSGAALELRGHGTLRPVVLSDLDGQARRELADRYPAIFLRQLLRLVAKYQIQQRLERENPWAGLAAQIFNLLTDGADTRGWLTLPAALSVAHRAVPPGPHALAWKDATGASVPSEVELAPGDLLLLFADHAGAAFTQDWVRFDSSGRARQPDAPTAPLSTTD
jgi:uncharacterized protein